MRNPHCIRSSLTQCDLSNSLTELRSSYMAEVLSEPPFGETSDLTEFPYSRSSRFCPYNDSRWFCSCLGCSPSLEISPGGNEVLRENRIPFLGNVTAVFRAVIVPPIFTGPRLGWTVHCFSSRQCKIPRKRA